MSGKRVLVVEDDASIGRLLQRALRLQGVEVTLAADGSRGRAEWLADGFDLVLLDVMLPQIDGISLCAERRAAGDRTPVIMLTAHDDATTRARGLAAGASEYMTKPFAYADLLRHVKRFLCDERAG